MAAEWTPNRIKRERSKAKMTQRQLAKLIGVTEASISQWETGVTTPTADNRDALTRVLLERDFTDDSVGAQLKRLSTDVTELRSMLEDAMQLLVRLAARSK